MKFRRLAETVAAVVFPLFASGAENIPETTPGTMNADAAIDGVQKAADGLDLSSTVEIPAGGGVVACGPAIHQAK